MASKRQLVLTVLGNAKGAVDALRLTGAESKKLTSTLASASKYISIGFAAIGAAGAYMGKQVFDGAMMAVRAAAEDEKSVRMLTNQIQQSTYATQQQITANEQFIASLQFTAAVADSELRPALANLVRATGSLSDSQKLLQVALDISAATGKELNLVTLALGRAATGNIGALTRLGIPLDENTKKSKNFNAVVEQLTKSFGGASATAVDTFDGRMRQLKIGIDEAIESIGYALLPFAERLVTFINNNIVPAIQIFANNVGKEGIGKAALMGIASLGDLGDRGIDAAEAITLGVLQTAKSIVDMTEKVAAAATLFGMLTMNAQLTFKAIAAGYASDVAQDKIGEAIKDTPAAFDKLRGAVESARKAMEDSGRTTQAWQNMTQDFRGTRKKDVELEKDYSGAVGGTTKETKKAEDALKEYARQLDQSRSAIKSSVRASADLKRADREVTESLRTLNETRERFNQIVRGYGAGSSQAADRQRDLARSQRDVERAGYDVEQAVFAVGEAERRLAELRADPANSPEEVRLAEIAVAEARLAVTDATDAQYQSTVDLAEAQRQLDITVNGAREGSQEYADALAELENAQRSYESAIESQIDAREREAEAIKKVREEEEALAELRKKLPKGTTFDDAGNATPPATPAAGSKFPNFMAAVRALHPNAPSLDSKTPVKASRAAFPNLYKEYKDAGLALAEGGIVRRPTTALIGEAGPEAVIPLKDIASMGSTNVYVTVNAGIGVDPAVVGDEIVNILQRYNRRNGALPLKVA